MRDVHGTSLPDLSRPSLRTGITRLFDRYRDAFDDGPLVVLPDAHYPHHPSTGLVTNADVVFELIKDISDSIAIDHITIGIPSSRFLDAEQAAQFLGYERISDVLGIELVDLANTKQVERTVHIADESVALSIPKPLLEGSIINVPTIRRSSALGLEAGMVNLARSIGGPPNAVRARAATQLCDSVVTLVDGTYVYAGRPQRPAFLFASQDVQATSVVAADLLELDHREIPHLAVSEKAANRPTEVTGLNVKSIADGMQGTEPPSIGETDMLAKGYRLYARLARDLVPPQMLPVGGPSDG